MNIRLSLTAMIFGCVTLLAACASEPPPNINDPVVRDFYRGMLASMNAQNAPAQEALLAGAHGDAFVDFVYDADGKVSNAHLVSRPQDNRIDKAAVYAVEHAVFPTKPASVSGISHFEMRMLVGAGKVSIDMVFRQPGSNIEFFGGA